MTQRVALLAAAGITAFVLVVMGGVIARSTATAAPEAPQAPVAAAQVQAQAPAQSEPAAQVDPVADYPISLSDAARIAAPLVPGARLTRAPELVDYQGTVAYEFATDRGLIYVDATTGQVLYNGAQTTQARGGDDSEHEHEHEEHGDDD